MLDLWSSVALGLTILLALKVVALVVWVWLGGLWDVQFCDVTKDAFVLAFKEHEGDYAAIVRLFAELSDVRRALALPDLMAAICYSDPLTTPATSFKAAVGIVCSPAMARARGAELQLQGLELREVPRTRYRVCQWRLCWGLRSPSLVVALNRIYGAAGAEFGRGSLELYRGGYDLEVCSAMENREAFLHPKAT